MSFITRHAELLLIKKNNHEIRQTGNRADRVVEIDFFDAESMNNNKKYASVGASVSIKDDNYIVVSANTESKTLFLGLQWL